MNCWDILLIIINLLGALGVFLFGMTLMSTGLQKVAGSGMRTILGKITGSPISGILAGVLVTAVIQSSSATTVMVVSFVNAGLMSLAGAIAVIMGANIGTTMTAWIIILFGLGGGSGTFSLTLLSAAIALLFFFSKKSKMKNISEFVFGFAILLVGLQFLQDAIPDLQQYPALLQGIASLSGYGFLSVIIFVVIGALLTCIVQSSSAALAITLVLCNKGLIGFDMAVALVMGQNIGTTITANIAAVVANTAAKRAARAHLVFNVAGVIFTLIVFYPLLALIANLTESFTGVDPSNSDLTVASASIPLALTIFHTFFNVANTIILSFFIPLIIKIVTVMMPAKEEDSEDEFHLTYISHNMMQTGEISLQAAEKEVEMFSALVLKMFKFLPELRSAKTEEDFEKVFTRIEKNEALTDRMELEITKYLTNISSTDLSKVGSQRVNSLLRIIDNLESIGDSILQIAIVRKNKRETAVHFDQSLNDNIAHMRVLVERALDVMDCNLKTDFHDVCMEKAYAAEEDINKYRDELRLRHLNALKEGVYDYETGAAYSAIYALYEKLADYVINVSEAIDNSKKVAENVELLQELVDAEDDMPRRFGETASEEPEK